MDKRIYTQTELDEFAKAGMGALAEVVGKTLGPGGLPILIQRTGQALNGTPLAPRITKDGVSVANECSSSVLGEDLIMQTVKAICQKTNTEAGDGTTTAIILGHAIFELASKKKGTTKPGASKTYLAQDLKRSLDKAGEEVIEMLKKASWPIQDFKEVKEVATLSANGDEEVGEVIAKAFQAVGSEGVVTVDEGPGEGLALEKVEGYRFQRGAQGRDTFFNNKSLSAFEAENASVILFDGVVQAYTELIPLLKILAQVDNKGISHNPPPPIVIIANDFSRDALQWMLVQKAERGVQFCPVIGPNISHVRTGYLEDLATFTGGKKLGNGGRSLSAITENDIGSTEKVVVDRYKTTLYGARGAEEDILRRVDLLKAKKATDESAYDAQVTNDRIAALTGGIAKILIGGRTEIEIKERYDRVEDALNAARAAIKEGVVVGGGVALLRIAQKFQTRVRTIGEEIISEALVAPFAHILSNVGYSGQEVAEKAAEILEADKMMVFDAQRGEFSDAITAGILDPVLVTSSAFKNALSISGLLLTAGAMIVTEK